MNRLWPLLLLLAACTSAVAKSPKTVHAPAEIRRDAVWQGRVIIDGTVKVYKGAALTIRPGTEILFVRRDKDRDGLGDGTLIVEGDLLAAGTRQEPIRFRSAAADPAPGDWLEIRVDFSKNVHLRYCEITDSAHTLHAHFTRGLLEDCVIRGNIDGCRLGEASFVIRRCLIEENPGKGINFRNSTVEITRNIIRNNGSGIFLFETDRASTIRHNNIYGNLDNFRLGDFFTGTVSTAGNWWGTSDREEAQATVHDRRKDPAIGEVRIAPASGWVPGTGPRDALALEEAWRFACGGYVDAPPVPAGPVLYVPSWDGRLYALDFGGRLLWQRVLGEVADSPAAVDERTLYLQTWERKVWALDLKDGAPRWTFGYGFSPADDHRQGGVRRVADLLLVPAWNGTLFALEADTGRVRWSYPAGLPLRAAPVFDGDRLYLAGGAGALTALALDGRPLWQAALDAPLLSPPAVTPAGPVVVSRTGILVAFSREGEIRWRRDLGQTCFYGAPVHRRGAIYLGTAAGSLWKIDAGTGRTIWQRTGLGPLYGTPLLAEGRLFVGDNDGTLHAVGAESGDLLATFRAGGAIQSTPVQRDGRLFFGSRDGFLYALHLHDLFPPERP